jgi:hypothetical protein
MAGSLAVSIKHQADLRGLSRNSVDEASTANGIISDVADAVKHGRLRNESRNNTLQVASCFEFREGEGFRFIRNAITIDHATYGGLDFMLTALAASQYWLDSLHINFTRSLALAEASNDFFPSAYLYFNPKYCINMKNVQLRFFEKRGDGAYHLADPPEVLFEVFEAPSELGLG